MTGSVTSRRDADDIAIVGMACLFPAAANISEFWKNIVAGHDAITEVPPEQFDSDRYYDAQSNSFQRIYCRRGGFITSLTDFDPLKYGIMPNAVAGADPDQFLAMKVAVDALSDAGYLDRAFNREKAEVILGRTSAPGIGALGLIQRGHGIDQVLSIVQEQFPDCSPEELSSLAKKMQSSLPPCNADTIPGVMPNVLAGRIASRLGFGGRNLILDAACASSLVALEMCVKDLLSGDCDLALAGGIHVNSNAFFYQMFCGIGALSRRQQIRPFSAEADGTLLGDGVAMVVLKRKQDAIRDGDRIYASILGVGSSSDGAGTSVLAPSAEGEALAIRRAFEMAGVSPSTVGLLEAHGTATALGDAVEMQAVSSVFGSEGQPWCALGSVKSMIGHTQAASGMAGLIKSALALYHRVLPPTLHAEQPNPKIDWTKSPCYLNTRTRPWVNAEYNGESPHPRRAAVSAFGFGGVNAHAVLEESTVGAGAHDDNLLRRWDSELCLLRAPDIAALQVAIEELRQYISAADASLADIAFSLSQRALILDASFPCAALVVSSVAELDEKLGYLDRHLRHQWQLALDGTGSETGGIYYQARPSSQRGQVAFVLSGLGAAYPNMLAELCVHFPEVRAIFDTVDQLSLTVKDSILPSSVIFPRSTVGDNAFGAAALASMDSAVVTVLLVEYALHTLLKKLEITPDALIGCSTGEFAGVVMGGAVDVFKAVELFYRLSLKVARAIPKEKFLQLSSIRVDADFEKISPLIDKCQEPVYLTADLAPNHIVVTGSRSAVKELVALIKNQGIESHVLPLAIPYHTSLVEGVVNAGQREVQDLPMSAPVIPTWSCSTGQTYPDDVAVIRQICTDLFTKPIRLRETIERAYESGVRTFIEVGPRGGLIKLIKDTLGDRPHLAVAADVPNRGSIAQLNNMLGALAVNCVSMNLEYLFKHRHPQQLDFTQLTATKKRTKTESRLSLTFPEMHAEPVLKINRADVGYRADSPGDDAGGDLAAVDEVVAGYLSSLGDFHQQMMRAQQEIMAAYLLEANPAEAQMADSNLPFIVGAEVAIEQDACTVTRTLRLETDKYLLDHAIGAAVSAVTTDPSRVYLLPLMVALEIMAETASLLEPEKVVTKIESVRAYRRIRVGKEGFPLTARAQRDESGIKVELFETNSFSQPLMECRVVFAESYLPAPMANPLVLTSPREPRINPIDLYSPATMFHGPRMQSVVKLDAIGQQGTTGQVRRRVADDWFAGDTDYQFLIDPLLLDNASQLVLYHLFEQGQPVSALLPFLIDSVEFYEPAAASESQVAVQAHLSSVTSRGTVANVEVVGNDGKVIVRISEIRSRSIMLPEACRNLVMNGRQAIVGEDLTTEPFALGKSGTAVCVRDIHCPDEEGTLDWLTDYVLSANEAKVWINQLRAEKRKRQWLMGRLAAKQAVQSLIERVNGAKLCLADIEIGNSENGSPYIRLPGALSMRPKVSISHSDDYAIAVAVEQEVAEVGVDVEAIAGRDSSFEEMAFNTQERSLFAHLQGKERDTMVTRLWCAKEAVTKALQLDLMPGLKALQCESVSDTHVRVLHQRNVYEVSCQLNNGYVVAIALKPSAVTV